MITLPPPLAGNLKTLPQIQKWATQNAFFSKSTGTIFDPKICLKLA
jgi:hypothetical protein